MAAPMECRRFLFSIVFSAVLTLNVAQKDSFDEELFVKPLESGHVLFHFQFTTKWDVNLYDKSSFLHYHLFPKSLGEVLDHYSVQELHLTQTQGIWRYEKWGYPVQDAAPGAELAVWFQEHTRNVDDKWTDLINVLSGMFCASLNFMDQRATVSPRYSFRPQGAAPTGLPHLSERLLRYAALPREHVCTENLTPWKKLLPCTSRSGLATLFNAIKLYDASYHSLGIHFRPVCRVGALLSRDPDCTVTSLELSQSLSVVFEPSVINNGRPDWSFKTLFNRMLSSSCPLAENSKVYVDISSNKSVARGWKLNPAPPTVQTVRRGNTLVRYAVYDIPRHLSTNNLLNLEAKYNSNHLEYVTVEKPVLTAHRYQTGYGQEKGGISCIIYNRHHSNDITIVYMETIPWFLRVYFHTLKIEHFLSDDPVENGTTAKPIYQHYIPGKDRQRSYQLELVLRLPANSRTKLSVQFERALLKWTEYPPDANHGFYVTSAVISTRLPSDVISKHYIPRPQHGATIAKSLENTTSDEFIRLHTESLLITLPTPDFSMPYNVICLACTVVAIAFGSIHNLTTRRFVKLDPAKKKGLKTKVVDFFNRIRGKKSTEEGKEKNGGENVKNSKEKSDKNKSENVGDSGSDKEEGAEDDSEIVFNFKKSKTKPRKR